MNIKFAKYLTENSEIIEKTLRTFEKRFSLDSNTIDYINASYWYTNVSRPYYYLELEDINKCLKKNYNNVHSLFDYRKLYKYNSCFCTYEDMKLELDKQLKEHSKLNLMYSYSFNKAKGKYLQIPIKYIKELDSIIYVQFENDKFHDFDIKTVTELNHGISLSVFNSHKLIFLESQIDCLNRNSFKGDPNYADK